VDHSAAVGAVSRHFDRLGGLGWGRADTASSGCVSLEVHRRFLRRFVPRGARVLQVGAGTDRFTTELAARGGCAPPPPNAACCGARCSTPPT
jgi:hypothetical protein